jgi:hypothetical protein
VSDRLPRLPSAVGFSSSACIVLPVSCMHHGDLGRKYTIPLLNSARSCMAPFAIGSPFEELTMVPSSRDRGSVARSLVPVRHLMLVLRLQIRAQHWLHSNVQIPSACRHRAGAWLVHLRFWDLNGVPSIIGSPCVLCASHIQPHVASLCEASLATHACPCRLFLAPRSCLERRLQLR